MFRQLTVGPVAKQWSWYGPSANGQMMGKCQLRRDLLDISLAEV
jgi:hypothetical protein